VRIHAEEQERMKRVSPERAERDRGNFTLPDEYFDHIIYHDYKDHNTRRNCTKLVLRVSQKFNP
jgi:hypothetical protein